MGRFCNAGTKIGNIYYYQDLDKATYVKGLNYATRINAEKMDNMSTVKLELSELGKPDSGIFSSYCQIADAVCWIQAAMY